MDTRFREITTRPAEPAEANLEPDGTVELHWPAEGLTVLLSLDEAQHLVSEVNGATRDTGR